MQNSHMGIEPSLTQAIILRKMRQSAFFVPVTLVHCKPKTCSEHILLCKKNEALLSSTGIC